MTRTKLTLLIAVLALFSMAPPALADRDAAVDAWIRAWSDGPEHLEDFLTEDVAYKDPFFSTTGRQAFLNVIATGHANFSRLEIQREDLLLDGDRGVLIWSVRSTDRATGNTVELDGVSVLRFRGERIAAEWKVYDSVDFARQLGATVTWPDGAGSAD